MSDNGFGPNLLARLESAPGVTFLTPDQSAQRTKWISSRFPVTASGVDWGRMPDFHWHRDGLSSDAAKTAALNDALHFLGAHASETVNVTWSDGDVATLEMSVQSCIKHFDLLLSIAHGLFVFAIDGGWLIEIDFYDECHAWRVEGE